MPDPLRYSSIERQAEKERQRSIDAADLSSGRLSRSDLRSRNGFLSALDVIDSRIECRDDFE